MSSSKIFGMSLEDLMQRPNQSVIPTVPKKLILTLNTDELLITPGIFRIDVRQDELDAMKLRIDSGETIDFPSLRNPHMLAGLLRLFFRELPEPLFTFDLYSEFVRISVLPDDSARLAALRGLLSRLPACNVKLAEVMLLFLARVTEKSFENKMTSASLATIFANGFVRPRVDTLETMLEVQKLIGLVQFMIEHFDNMFPRKKINSLSNSPSSTGSGILGSNSGNIPIPNTTNTRSRAGTMPSSLPPKIDDEREKAKRVAVAVDNAIAVIQQQLAGLNQMLGATDSMEEAVEIARVVTAAKRILSEAYLEDGKNSTGNVNSMTQSGNQTLISSGNIPVQTVNLSSNGNMDGNSHSASTGQERPKCILVGGAFGLQGARRTMEDEHVMCSGLPGLSPGGSSVFAIFDGHGGARAAQEGAKTLPVLWAEHLVKVDLGERCEEATVKAYEECDEHILRLAGVDGWRDGSTCTALLFDPPRIILSNVGDAESLLIHPDGTFLLLSSKHKADAPEERLRVQQAGGHVVFGRLFGDLAVSRALGDREYKKPISDADFVSCRPFCVEISLNRQVSLGDTFLLACDGVFDVLTYEAVAARVIEWKAQGCNEEECAKKVAEWAVEKGSKDNCSACVVYVVEAKDVEEGEKTKEGERVKEKEGTE